jgi:flagellar biosynthesis protein FlhB
MTEHDRTEKASPQRRKKAREQGQIARSRDLPNLLALAGAALTVLVLCTGFGEHWRSFYVAMLHSASTDDLSPNGPILFWMALEVIRWVAPVLVVAMLLSVGAGLAQGGLNVAPAALQFKFNRFDPASRLRQIFSLTTLGSLGKSTVPFAVIAALGWQTLHGQWNTLTRGSEIGLESLVQMMGTILRPLVWKSGLVLMVWAAVDYALVWRQTESQLKMSKEELKKEHKETDGNPHTKRQIRRLQRGMRKRRSLQAAATATLVVTNPTHYAVALRYESSMAAPEVVAKGRDLLAQQIKEIAREHAIPVMENKPLAQALYKTVEVGDCIPGQLYQAVAEVLVIVFRVQAEVRERERQRAAKNAAGETVNQW